MWAYSPKQNIKNGVKELESISFCRANRAEYFGILFVQKRSRNNCVMAKIPKNSRLFSLRTNFSTFAVNFFLIINFNFFYTKMISETSSTKLDKKKKKLDTLCFLWLSTHGTTLWIKNIRTYESSSIRFKKKYILFIT